jgi:hypothetical protein
LFLIEKKRHRGRRVFEFEAMSYLHLYFSFDRQRYDPLIQLLAKYFEIDVTS